MTASRPSVTVTAPGTSSLGRASGRDSLITLGATSRTARTTGTLMKNAHRQDSRSVSTPPRTAPAVNPLDISAPLRPSAFARSGPSGNEVVSSDSPAGVTAAVASPWRTRAVISVCGFCASPPRTEAAPSTARPPRKSRRRPNRSATRPKNSVKPAAHSANDVAIHCRCASEKPRLPPITGSATFRMAKSTASMNCAASSTTSTSRSRRVSTAGAAATAGPGAVPACAVSVTDMTSSPFLLLSDPRRARWRHAWSQEEDSSGPGRPARTLPCTAGTRVVITAPP